MKIYTRKGDDGTTGLLFGGRVAQERPLSRRPTARSTRRRPSLGLARAEAERGLRARRRARAPRARPVGAHERAGLGAREPLEAHARAEPRDRGDGRPHLEHLIDQTTRALRAAHRVRGARARTGSPRCSTWPAPSCAEPSARPSPRPTPPSHVLPYLNRLSDLLWTTGPLAGGRVAHDALGRPDE